MPLRFDIESGKFVKIDEKKDRAGRIKGDKGDKGDTPALDEIRAIIIEELAKMPTPKDGESIDPAGVMAMVAEMVAKIPKPKDGESVTIDDIMPIISEAIAAVEIKHGKDGVGIADVLSDGSSLIFHLSDGSKKTFPLPEGKGVELKTSQTHVLWRCGDGEWAELFAIPRNKTVTGGGGGKSTANIQAMIDAAIAANSATITSSDDSLTVAGSDVIINQSHDVNWQVKQIFNGAILNSYTVDAVTGTPTATLNYGIGGNWIAGGYTNQIAVYAYRTIAGLGRVYSAPTYSTSYLDNNSANNLEFDWVWAAVAGASGYIVTRYSNDPLFPYNFDYYVDVGNVTAYSDYGDEWTPVTFQFNTTLNEYSAAQEINGYQAFIPNRSADGSASSPIFRIGAGDALQQRLTWQNSQWEFLDASGLRGTVYANINAAGVSAVNINGVTITGTFTGTVNKGLTANKVAIWDSSNNLNYNGSFFYGTDINGFGVSIGNGGGTISGAYKLWLNDSVSNATYLLFTNGSTGNANSNGFAFGLDTVGAVLFNNRANTSVKWYQSGAAAFVMILNNTGELTIGGNQALGSVGAQCYVQAVGTGKIAAITRGALSGTVDIQQYLDGSGNIGTKINKNAAIVARAGSTTALTAPLYYVSGALMTTAEVGAQEFLTDKYYGTITTGAARKEFTLNDIALTSGWVPVATTNGRLTGSAFLTSTASSLLLSYAPSAATSTNKVQNSTVVGTFNTTAGVITQYAAYYSNTATRSAGANNLTNVGLYAEASGGQLNNAIITGAGRIGLNTAAPNNPLQLTAGSSSLSFGEYSSGNAAIYFGSGAISSTNWNFGGTSSGDTSINTQSSINFRLNGTVVANMNSSSNWILGSSGSASARLHLVSTTVQQRTAYDASNYYDTTVSSTGGVTFDATGTGAGFTFVDKVTTQSGRNVKVRVVTAAGAVTVATSDYIVEVNKTVGAATAVNLPASPTTGDTYIIKDGKRDASTNNITITPAAGNIEGAGTYVMNTNGQSAQIYYSGTEWKVI